MKFPPVLLLLPLFFSACAGKFGRATHFHPHWTTDEKAACLQGELAAHCGEDMAAPQCTGMKVLSAMPAVKQRKAFEECWMDEKNRMKMKEDLSLKDVSGPYCASLITSFVVSLFKGLVLKPY